MSLHPTHGQLTRASLGFSLVELMVALALSLILLAGVLSIFASSRTTYETTDRLSRIQESGRFALDVITRDLRSAGYRGCSKRAEFENVLRDGATELLWNFAEPVGGFDADDTGLSAQLASAGAPDAIEGSDALIVRGPRLDAIPIRMLDRMTDTTSIIPAEADARIEAGDIVMMSDCEEHAPRSVFQVTAVGTGTIGHDDVAADEDAGTPGNSSEDIGFAFGRTAEIIPVQTSIYYLRVPPAAPAGTSPSLYRRVSGGGSAEELVEGVENMQVLYGERVAGSVDYRKAQDVDDWTNVVTVRIAFLVRSLSEYGTDAGPATFDLLGVSFPNPGDRHMRQVFTTTVNVRNSSI